MIISITLRHGTESEKLRSQIEYSCKGLTSHHGNISRVNVTIFIETHHKISEKKFNCHISTRIEGKPPLDIYEAGKSSRSAFNHCLDRVMSNFSRLQHRKEKYRGHSKNIRFTPLIEGEINETTQILQY